MNEVVEPEENIVSLLHKAKNDVDVPVPFERDIFLFATYVAGTSHITGMEELAGELKPKEHLRFYREPDNHYDPQAIKITTDAGTKIGYVPKADNAVFSRLMDAGKLLFGVIQKIDIKGNYAQISIHIYLHE